MPRPDEGLIHAWLDGELDAAEAARVGKLVAEDAEWGAAAAEARGLIAASSRILGALDVVAGDVIPGGGSAAPAFGAPQKSHAPRLRFAVRPWMRIAAGVVLVAGVGYVARGGMRPQVMQRGGTPREAGYAAAGGASADVVTSAPPVAPLSASPRAAPRPEPSVAAKVEAELVPARTRIAAATAERGASPAPGTAASEALRDGRVLADSAAVGKRDFNPVADSAAVSKRDFNLADVVVTGVAEPQLRETRKVVANAAPQPALRARQDSGPTATVPGCWRTETAASADSVLVNPRVVRQVGDTLVVVISQKGGEAMVVRSSADLLQGAARTEGGAVVTFRAVRVGCPE